MTHQPLSVFFPFSLRLSSISEAFEILYALMPRRPYFFLLFCEEGFQYHLASNYVVSKKGKKKKNLTGERNVNLQKGIKITGVLRKEKRHTCRYLMENPSACSLVDKSTNEAKVTQNMLCLEVKGFASKLHCCGIF